MRLMTAILLAFTALSASAASRPLPEALAPYAGRVVLLDFWASWCGPCAESFPWLNEMQARYGQDLAIVGVNVDADAAAADAFLRKHPATFGILRDPEGALPEFYEINGMPSSVILDRDGRVLHQHSGFRKQQLSEYEAAIRQALGRRQEARQ